MSDTVDNTIDDAVDNTVDSAVDNTVPGAVANTVDNAVDNSLTLQLNEILKNVLQPFDITAQAVGDWLVFLESSVLMQGRVAGGGRMDEGIVAVQVDICVQIDGDRVMVQSFPGVGDSEDEAVINAFENFFAHSFHLILATFFDVAKEEVTIEEWDIAGLPRRVVFGHAIRKGDVPEELTNGEFPWFGELEARIKNHEFPPGTHWVEMHFAQNDGDLLLCDVRLDNDEWQPARNEIADLGWPAGDSFYSVRLFLTIGDV